MSNDKETVLKLEEVLIEICSIYQSIVVDINGVLTELEKICKCPDALSTIAKVKVKHLPQLDKVRILTERIIESADVIEAEIPDNALIH